MLLLMVMTAGWETWVFWELSRLAARFSLSGFVSAVPVPLSLANSSRIFLKGGESVSERIKDVAVISLLRTIFMAHLRAKLSFN